MPFRQQRDHAHSSSGRTPVPGLVRQNRLLLRRYGGGGRPMLRQAPRLQLTVAAVGVLHYSARGRGAPTEMVKVAAESLPAMLRAGGLEREAASQELRDLLVRAALSYLARQQYPAEAF